MKLGFIAQNSIAGLEKDAEFAVLNGYRGLEFNYWGDFKNVEESTILQMRSILDNYGIECSTFGIWGFNHIAADAAERKAAHHELDRAIKFASLMGSPALICGGGNCHGDDLDANIATFAEVMNPYLAKAQNAGLKVCLYGFHGGSFLDSVAAYEKLWETVPDVGIKFDPANINHAGQDYLHILRHHGSMIYHVHIKEHAHHNGELASQPAAGMGDIHWGKVMAFLYEADYRGYLVVEPHGPLWGRAPLRQKMLVLTRKYMSQFLL